MDIVITTSAEWLNLPEPMLPKILLPTDHGSIYQVSKVGFLEVSANLCSKRVMCADSIGSLKQLPVVFIECGHHKELCKLPIELSAWVRSCLEFESSGHNPFPSLVEFGQFDGQVYAQLLGGGRLAQAADLGQKRP